MAMVIELAFKNGNVAEVNKQKDGGVIRTPLKDVTLGIVQHRDTIFYSHL